METLLFSRDGIYLTIILVVAHFVTCFFLFYSWYATTRKCRKKCNNVQLVVCILMQKNRNKGPGTSREVLGQEVLGPGTKGPRT